MENVRGYPSGVVRLCVFYGNYIDSLMCRVGVAVLPFPLGVIAEVEVYPDGSSSGKCDFMSIPAEYGFEDDALYGVVVMDRRSMVYVDRDVDAVFDDYGDAVSYFKGRFFGGRNETDG